MPESLGNDDLVLTGQVCAKCNQHFGAKVEAEVLHHSPLAFWRAFLGIQTKKGALPSVDLSQPSQQRGPLPSRHPFHDHGIGFTAHGDGSTSVDISDPKVVEQIRSGQREHFMFVLTPKVLMVLGRFLCKMGVELAALDDPRRARLPDLRAARQFARYGELPGLWPIFHYSEGNIRDLRRPRVEEGGLVEDVTCFGYRLLEVDGGTLLIEFGMGTDRWVICLTDPSPGAINILAEHCVPSR